MRPRTVAQRLLLVSALSLLPAAIIGAFAFIQVREDRLQTLHDDAFRAAELASLELSHIVSGTENVLLAISAMPIVKRQDTKGCSAALGEMVGKLPFLSFLAVFNADGTVRCVSQEDRSSVFAETIKAALATEERVIGKTEDGVAATSPLLLPIARRIGGDPGDPLGVAVGLLNLDWVQREMAQRRIDAMDSLAVVDSSGKVLVRVPHPEKFVGTIMSPENMWLLTAPKPGTYEITSIDGMRRVLGYFPPHTNPSGLYVSAGKNIDAGLAVANSIATTSTLVGFIGAAAVATLSVYTARRFILQPVATLVGTVLAWRSGDSTARTHMRAEDGEICGAGQTLDAFMDELQISRAARKKSEEDRELMRHELEHRVRNLLATINAIARQTFSQTGNEQAIKGFSQRIVAIAEANRMLQETSGAAMSLHRLARASTSPFVGSDQGRCTIDGPELTVEGKVGLALSMALHELCTNAAKYGALSNDTGTISLKWKIQHDLGDDLFVFVWKESGGPAVTPPIRSGFGSKLIEGALASKISGAVKVSYEPGGLVCTIKASAANVIAEPVAEPVFG